MKRLIAAAGVLTLVSAACARGPAPLPVGTLTPVSGLVEVLRPDGWTTVTEETELAPGDQVRTDAEGAARLQVSALGSIELGPSSRVRLAGGDASDLMVGSVLATGSGLSVRVGRATVSPESTGAFRMDRGFSTRVGVYEGSAVVEALGAPVTVGALEQVVVLAHLEPSRLTPLWVRAADPWDRRMLGAAIDLGQRVGALERGVRGAIARQPQPAVAIAEALPATVSATSVAGLLQRHQVASRVLVSLALASVTPGISGIVATARSILTDLEQGASWMVVVAGLGLTEPVGLVDRLGGVLAAITVAAGGPPDADGSPTPDDTQDPDPPTTDPSPDPTDPTDPTPPPCPPGDTGCEAERALEEIIGGFSGGGDRDDDPGGGIIPGT